MIIVCGTDFSTQSLAAEDTAAALATLTGGKLSLVHVLDPATDAWDAEAREAVKASAQKRLQESADRIKVRTGRGVRHLLLSGFASDAIREFAAAENADLVVVASRGHGATPLYRVGGTSERLAQSTDRPLLVVRSSSPFDAWARRERPLRMLLAVDWTRSSDPAIRWTAALREAAPCDVVVGYIYYSGSTGDGCARYGLRAQPLSMPEPETEELLARDLASRVGALGGTGEICFRPKHGIGRLGDHLLALAETERVDLVVVGTHHKGGLRRLGSVASVTLHHCHSAVAVIPLPDSGMARTDEVPRIRRVVVPTDLSPLSNAAVAAAYALPTDRSGEVLLLHVANEDDAATDTEIAARLRSAVPTHGVPATIETRTEIVRHRNPARAIREAADRLGADVICMSSHGRTGIKRAVLGSVAEAVLREARCPVFIVHPLPP